MLHSFPTKPPRSPDSKPCKTKLNQSIHSGWVCLYTTLLGAAPPVAATVTSWVTMAWFVGQEESALLATMLCAMPYTTLLLLLGSPHRRRAALRCLATTRDLLTSSSHGGQEDGMQPLT